MRETFSNYRGKLVASTKNLLTRPLVAEDEETAASSLQSKLATPQVEVDHPAPLAEEKRKKRRSPFVALALLVVFAPLSIFSLFGQSLPALAASTHMAHKASAAQAHDDVGGDITSKVGDGKPWYCYALVAMVTLASITVAGYALQGANVLISTPMVLGSGGTVETPGAAQAGINLTALAAATGAGIGGGIALIKKLPECSGKPADQVLFDCSDNSDGTPNISTIKDDWLSGNPKGIDETGPKSGHIVRTYAVETYEQQGVKDLSDYAQMLGFMLITPSIILIGYQLLIAVGSSFRHASALEAFTHVLLGVLAIMVSHDMVKMLIGLENTAADAFVALHGKLGYYPIKINGDFSAPYGLSGDDSTSYRGIVMPMSRWGCAANDFIAILGVKLLSDIFQYLPFVGGFLGLAGKIITGDMLLKAIGELTLLILSISLWAQILFRLALLNYYIVMAPVAFGCWGLPGGVGQAVVSKWAKGFIAVLSLQVVQIFILSTFPLILPTDLSGIPLDKLGIFKGLILEFPRILVLIATLKGPKLLAGENPLNSIAQAGTVAGSTAAALGAAAWQIV